MQSQERDLITDLFGRLKAFETQPRDGEAERLIAGLVAMQPASPYLLTQTVLVQEHALKAAQERIAELESKESKPAPSGGGFLGGAPKIGPWGSAPSATPAGPSMTAPPTRSPLQEAVAPQQPAAGGSSFMRTALTTAAGVAGGALLFQGVRSLLGNGGGPFSAHAAAPPAPAQAAPLLGPTDDNLRSAEADVEEDDDASDDYDTASDDSDSGGADSDDT